MRQKPAVFHKLQYICSVEYKEDRSEDRTLGYTKPHCRRLGSGHRRSDILCTSSEVCCDPLKCNVTKTIGLQEVLTKGGMIVTIEGCRQVKKCQKCQVPGIQCKEDVGHHFEHGSFSGMVNEKTRRDTRPAMHSQPLNPTPLHEPECSVRFHTSYDCV